MESRHPIRRDVVFCLVALAGVVGFYTYHFLGLFPLIEFREWITTPVTAAWLESSVKHVVVRDQLFSRDVSMVYSVLTGWLGGTDIQVLNMLVLLPVFGAGVSLFALGRQLGIGPFGSLSAVWLWAFSLPVVDAAAWQATINDRLALFFSTLCLNTTFAALRATRRARSLLLGNGAAGFFLVMAYNSKEIAFFLGPTLLLIVVVYGRGQAPPLSRKLPALAVPLCYALYHNARYFSQLGEPANESWSQHVLGADLLATGGVSARHVMGLAGSASIYLAVVPWLVVVALGIYVLAGRTRGRHDLLWLSGALLSAVSTTLQAKHSPPFYQYVPRALLAMLVVTAVCAALDRSVAGNRLRNTVLVVGLALNFCVLYFHGMPPYREKLEMSRNLVASFQDLRTCVNGNAEDAALELVIPLPGWKVYGFYWGPELAFYRFVFSGRETAGFSRDVPVKAEVDVDMKTWVPADPDTIYVTYDERLELAAVFHDGRRLCDQARRGPP